MDRRTLSVQRCSSGFWYVSTGCSGLVLKYWTKYFRDACDSKVEGAWRNGELLRHNQSKWVEEGIDSGLCCCK